MRTVNRAKKTYRRGRRVYQKGKGIWNAVKKVGGLAVKALAMLNSESKHVDTAGNTAASNAWQYDVLNTLSQGDTATSREGDAVEFKSLYCQYLISRDGTSATKFEHVRIMIVHDAFPHGNSFDGDIATFLDDGTDLFSNRRIGNQKRYTVLHDKHYILTPDTIGHALYRKVYINLSKLAKTKKFRGRNKSNYALGNNGSIVDISEGAYYLMWL